MIELESIITFVSEFTGSKKVYAETDIFDDLGCVGDDFFDLMEKYSAQFSVDMSNYLWYFHSDEEGWPSIGSEFFKPPYCRVERIPVTPAMLLDFANKGEWSVDYPEHTIPKIRWDVRINLMILIAVVVAIILFSML